MTKRLPVSVIQPLWHDSQKVDQEAMTSEQSHNNQASAAIVNNAFGSGILLSSPTQTVLFDSDNLDATQASILAAGNLDGTGLNPAQQPSDANLGNQLQVQLTDSLVFGRFSTKVIIIGLDFAGNVIYERLVFHKNEIQVTTNHFAYILTLLFNDFKGNTNCSRLFEGRIVISEAASFQLSRSPIMTAQDVEPNLIFRDFKTAGVHETLSHCLQTGMGSAYSFDALNITTTTKINRNLLSNDVVSQYGQKFLATTNNIQKITLTLGAVGNYAAPIANRFDWAGDLVFSLYPLQKTVNCPTDIIPELAIDFDPEITPIAQLSFNQTTLKSIGYVLNDVLQPVDFVLNNTQVSSTTNPVIQPGEYYAVTIRRSGAAVSGTLFTGIGNNKLDDSRETLFNGVWVDVPENDMWFQVWTDAAKLADGQGYDQGNGIDLPKTTIDSDTGASIDNQSLYHSFSDDGESVLNIGVIQAVEQDSVPVEDERTGSPINSMRQFVPSFSFVNEIGIQSLQEVSEPLIVGAALDINPKSNPTLLKHLSLPGLVKNDTFCIVNPDADLLSLNLIGSKLTPNTLSGYDYRIYKTTICTDGYGDVNGDGVIDTSDIARAAQLLGENLKSASTQTKIVNGFITTLEMLRADVDGDGYITANDVNLITSYVARTTNSFPVGSSFKHMCLQVQQSTGRDDGYYSCGAGLVRVDGYTGVVVVPVSALSPYQLLYDGYEVTPNINGTDNTFNTVPFPGVDFQILTQPFWQDYFLLFNSNARKIMASFTSSVGVNHLTEPPSSLITSCADRNNIIPSSDVGRNDIFIPDNLIIGSGEILRPDGSFYKVDYEVGQIILELPALVLTESTINIFDKFVADRGDHLTEGGFKPMCFADFTTVQRDALAKNQIRFSVSIQSISKTNSVIDETVGVYIDQANGILQINTNHLFVDPISDTKVTKIEVLVHLKKAGWVNTPLIINSTLIAGLIT